MESGNRPVEKASGKNGIGLKGVIHLKQKDDDELPLEDRYIHSISLDGFKVIVTMVPGSAKRIHLASSTLHDNTYKRVYGDWKEWEVVIWDASLNMRRVTVARIYCTHETRESFEKLWTCFWDTVETVTGKPVQFKFLDGTGLAAIIVDGCKPQANALGDALKKRITAKKASGACRVEIEESDPQVIVQYILRTCEIHLERKLDDLAKTLPKEDMERVRGFPFLETRAEVDEFVSWCEASEHKVLRDWMVDKKSCPWFIPSLNKFMSKIPRDDWFLTPGHTNLNESAHPFTNQHTGINLQIAEAIREARKLDLDVLSKIENAYKMCILPNAHNTQAERDRANRKRQESRAIQRTKRETTVDEIHEVRDKISELTQVSKDAAAQKKELREKEKALQQAAGLKRSPSKKNTARGKYRVPTANVIDTGSDTENANPFQPMTQSAGTHHFAQQVGNDITQSYYHPSLPPPFTQFTQPADPHFRQGVENNTPQPQMSTSQYHYDAASSSTTEAMQAPYYGGSSYPAQETYIANTYYEPSPAMYPPSQAFYSSSTSGYVYQQPLAGPSRIDGVEEPMENMYCGGYDAPGMDQWGNFL
ncbi:hypothetical protein CPC08DRAFT_721395 [Agrocybe pediades]|nr:hypothetical protein CPC08DRAFT_721395 [Agrocybe pediades]